MTSPLSELLELLQNEDIPLPTERLPDLSDPNRQDLQQFRTVWAKLSSSRRCHLIEELGRLADLRFELLFEPINRTALQDEEAEVRRIAIGNLWECDDPQVVPEFLSLLRHDPSTEVQAAAARAMGSFVLKGEMDEIDPALLREIEEALLEAVHATKPHSVRMNALESLGFSSRSEVQGLIRDSYASEHAPTRRSAMIAIGRSADKAWRAEVLETLRDPDPELRYEAVRAAGELDLRETTPEVIDLLQDALPSIRHASIWTLGQLGGPRAAETLAALLDENPDAQEAELIQDALDHLAFVDGTRDMLLIDFDEDEDLDI